MSEISGGLRIDVWLWHARQFKTRSLATAKVQKGRIRLTSAGTTRRISKPATLVRAGDTLTLPLNGRIVQLEILALGTRRGPASEARELYRMIDDGQSVEAQQTEASHV
ncbi:RNA-binding S4 domain-containing protein [Maricaulis maris]|uniref:Heat shock protein Hsp15 n=1 Tax=Maricaulis maris TaxID=74318 RepID=A0A495CY45_9PROT|nr:RNA-binding S4 domain-containing protein [Maricaulis maris]RKQ89490.1 heat shock protein Hsp15 [Maricaulis maris]